MAAGKLIVYDKTDAGAWEEIPQLVVEQRFDLEYFVDLLLFIHSMNAGAAFVVDRIDGQYQPVARGATDKLFKLRIWFIACLV